MSVTAADNPLQISTSGECLSGLEEARGNTTMSTGTNFGYQREDTLLVQRVP